MTDKPNTIASAAFASMMGRAASVPNPLADETSKLNDMIKSAVSPSLTEMAASAGLPKTAPAQPVEVQAATVEPQVKDAAPWQEAKDEMAVEKFNLTQVLKETALPSEAPVAEAVKPKADHAYPNLSMDMILNELMISEGGYANHPSDPGGETKHGISKRSYPHLDIPSITEADAKQIYMKDFFPKVQGEALFKKNPGLAAHVADIAFNSGPRKAAHMLSDVLGLPRQNTITPEMVDRVSGSEDLVKAITARRMSFYSSLGQSKPEFLKGWTNRVRDLNMVISSGKDGGVPILDRRTTTPSKKHKADLEQLMSAVQGYAVTEAKATMNEVNADGQAIVNSDKEYIKSQLSTGAKQAAPDVGEKGGGGGLAKRVSSIGEVFKNTFDEHFYLNTNEGLGMLSKQSLHKASEANRAAMGSKFTKTWMDSLTLGAIGGVNSQADFEAEVSKFKQANPGVKLPFESYSDVHAQTVEMAKRIEADYNKLNSGAFSDGVYESARKLAHVAAGYLPGHVAASLSDPVEAVSNAIPLTGAGAGVAAIAKGAALTMGGTALGQIGVQPKRAELGLDSGLEQAAANIAAAGAGYAALGAAQNLLSKIWNAGSKSAGEAASQFAEGVKKAFASEVPGPMQAQVVREAEDIAKVAKGYLNNPHGDHFGAKLEYETNVANAMQDLAQNKPVRIIDTPVTKVVPTPREYTKSVNSVLKPEAPKAPEPVVVTKSTAPKIAEKPVPTKVLPREDPEDAINPSPNIGPDDEFDLAAYEKAAKAREVLDKRAQKRYDKLTPDQQMRYDAKKAQEFFSESIHKRTKTVNEFKAEIDAYTVAQQNKAAIEASKAAANTLTSPIDRPMNSLGNTHLDDDIDPDAHHIFNNAMKQWNDLKKMSVERPKPRAPEDVPYSTVPLTKVDETTGDRSMYTFKDSDELSKFLDETLEGKALAKEHEVIPLTKEDGSLYLGRSADLEPGDNFTGRMTGPEVSEIERLNVSRTGNPLTPSTVKGFTGSEDLTLAEMFPDYAVAKPAAIRNELKEALYPATPQDVSVAEFLTRFADESKIKQLDGDMAFTKMSETMNSLEAKLSEGLTPGTTAKLSLSDDFTESATEFQSMKSVVDDLNEEKSAIKQLMSCMIGGEE